MVVELHHKGIGHFTKSMAVEYPDTHRADSLICSFRRTTEVACGAVYIQPAGFLNQVIEHLIVRINVHYLQLEAVIHHRLSHFKALGDEYR